MESTTGPHERQVLTANLDPPSLVAEDNPPSYNTIINAEESLFDAVNTALRTETICPHMDVNKGSVERLRNFLSFILAVDYVPTAHSPHSPDGRWRLSNTDLEHFVEVTEKITRFYLMPKYDKHEGPELAEHNEEMIQLNAYLLEHLLWPARSLGLPREYVIATMWRFFMLMSEYRQFTGSLRHILACYGVDGLASKLWYDRCVVVPRIVACEKLKKAVLEGIKETQTSYFKELEGARMEISHRASSGRGWCEVRWEKMELTDRTKRVKELTLRLFEKVDEGRAAFSDKNEQAAVGRSKAFRSRTESEISCKDGKKQGSSYIRKPQPSLEPVGDSQRSESGSGDGCEGLRL
ncbi:hypothetical protein BKCO1_1000617 [Neofusicoccum parvum]|uniref:Uncharacterized protein n=1 Tax=Neofusicoccum parvum TaxID=310453 RepID=A0ACB5SCR0_9PEZI|nr:hypothetical protein BKCO1_1000617 [Neofusicoccum parvum]